MTDKRAYFRLDVGYLSNPKIAQLAEDNPRAVLLHLQCIAYATQHATDGLVPMRLAMRQACAEQCDLDLLVQCGLLLRVDERNVEVHDYLEHQRSASEVKSASDKAKRAAEARWADAPSIAPSMPDAMPREKERKREEEDALRADFDAWYQTYPKKVAKPAALKAYKLAARKTNPLTLLAGAQVMGKAYATDKTYCPNPATWLNQERWLDEAPQQSPGLKPVPAERDHFTPPPAPEDIPGRLVVQWNLAWSRANREGRPGPADWREMEAS